MVDEVWSRVPRDRAGIVPCSELSPSLFPVFLIQEVARNGVENRHHNEDHKSIKKDPNSTANAVPNFISESSVAQFWPHHIEKGKD